MTSLFADITPNFLYTQRQELCAVDNRIVFQLRNPSSTHSVALFNKDGEEPESFPPLDKAAPISGLSVIYIKFRLGEDTASLTSVKLFAETNRSVPEDWRCLLQDGDTLVLHPRENTSIEPGGQMEFAIGQLRTDLPAGDVSIVEIRYFGIDTQPPASDFLPLYKLRHPLCIRKFHLESAGAVAGFRDEITFTWLVLGADEILFAPGDISLPIDSRTYRTTLMKRTTFVLTARCGDMQVSRPCEIVPLKADILSASCRFADSGCRQLVFTYEVSKTRHVFISQKGRVAVDDSGKGSCTLMVSKKFPEYWVGVENEGGFVKKTCVPE